jgi:dTDP-4-amino-4,6-dideoxygalactose transaminase
MNKPSINLSEITYDDQEIIAVSKVLKSRWISMGENTRMFETELGRFIGSPHVLAVTNGTAALHLALVSLGIGHQHEVIVPSLTFVATVNAVLYTGAKPVFADIHNLNDWTISVTDIKNTITPRTKAVIAMHYAGFPCEIMSIKMLTDKYNLCLVEDAAHGPGSWVDSRHIGTIGDIGCFSFFANKNLATAEGGAVVTDNMKYYELMLLKRSHGMTSMSWDRFKGHAYQYDVISKGYNYRFDDLRAAIGRVQLRKLSLNNIKRAEKYKYYINKLESISEVQLPFRNRNERISYHILPVLLAKNVNRLSLIKKLRALGIQTSIHYPPVHLFSKYKNYCQRTLPNTEIVGQRELTLPFHPLLRLEDIDYVVNSLKKSLVNDK